MENNPSKSMDNQPGTGASSSNSNAPPEGIVGSIPLNIGNRANNETIQFRVRGSTITAASPPKFISLAEIMNAAHGMQNMTLAHEIAIDHEFRLEPFEPPDNRYSMYHKCVWRFRVDYKVINLKDDFGFSYQKIVKDTMHRAFFDLLREELNSEPPIYKQAFVLLEDVKQGLFSILLPRHTKIREMIEEVLDNSFIRQQAENSALEFKKYSDFVLDLMAKLAAPCRDEMIQNISTMTDTVDIFQTILETLEVMKLDLANSLITMIRPYIQAQSVQYEQDKFKKFLEIQEDGLETTRAWIVPHIDKETPKPTESDPLYLKNMTAKSLASAYLELLDWDSKKPYPETVQMDAVRYGDLAKSLYRLVTSVCILLVSPTCGAPNQSTTQNFKMELKNKITILMQDVSNDSDFEKILPNIAEQITKDTDNLLQTLEQPGLNEDLKITINGQIMALNAPDHKVRKLVKQRILEFLKEILICGGGSKQVPIGTSAFHAELTSISGLLLRLVMHNKAVYSKYYFEIVAKELGVEG